MRLVFSSHFHGLKSAATATLCCLLLGACASTQKPKSPPAESTAAPHRVLVGEVAVVDEARRFVLVDLISNLYVPAPGVALRAINAKGETAHLRAAPERKRPFIAADIVDGHPAAGDLVVQ